MSDTPPPAESNAASPAPAKSRKMLFIIVAVVLLLAIGGGGFFYFQRSAAAKNKPEKSKKSKHAADDEESSDEETTDEHSDGKDGKSGKAESKSTKLSLPDDSAVKNVIELQPFIVNLADTEQARYLRLTVSVGVGESKSEGKADPLFTTRVRNAMLAVLTTKTSNDILTPEGKAKLRKELLRAAKSVVEEPEVQAIYITDFIVQL